MRWITHTGVAVGVAAALGAPPGMLVGITAGSVLPDAIDQTVAGRDRRLWSRIHREASHWWGWYVGLALLVVLLGGEFESLLREVLGEFMGSASRDVAKFLRQGPLENGVLGLALGALSHIALDALNPSGVPILPFSHKPRIRSTLVSTGSWKEYVFLVVALLLLGMNHEQVLRSISRW